MNIPMIVAEVGCNHAGNMDTARRMIESAAHYAHADYVKFQKRNNLELMTAEERAEPHPNPMHSFGGTYGEHRDFLEFDVEQHRQLKRWCEEFGVGYATSVWDLSSARQMADLRSDFLKVPSACNLNFDMLEFLAREYAGDIHLSVGMTTPGEIEEIVRRMEGFGAANRLVLYACTSGYPVPFDQVCLREIVGLAGRYGRRVKQIGFSGHHLGIAVDVAAMTLGARWIERHFTLDRTSKGTDHAASLEPDGLRKLVRDVRAVGKALTVRNSDILEIETAQRNKLKRLPGVHFR